MPKVSVIIPTYNRERFVSNAVESVLKQSFDDFEIIVVDNGSTDGTRQVLESYRNRIRCIYEENEGVSAARNVGIRSAGGEWLAFLDSDDEWTPEYLTRQMQRAGEAPEICMQICDCTLIKLDGQTKSYFEINGSLAELKGQGYLYLRDPFRFVIEHTPWQIGSTIIRNDAMHKAGLFDTSLTISEDLELMARVALQGPFALINEALVNIHRRDEEIESLTGQARRNPLWARESDEKMYEKLKRIEGLSRRERKALNEVMSANRRAIGNLLMQNGKVREARESYRRALFIHPSIRSLGKYLLSLPVRM